MQLHSCLEPSHSILAWGHELSNSERKKRSSLIIKLPNKLKDSVWSLLLFYMFFVFSPHTIISCLFITLFMNSYSFQNNHGVLLGTESVHVHTKLLVPEFFSVWWQMLLPFQRTATSERKQKVQWSYMARMKVTRINF